MTRTNKRTIGRYLRQLYRARNPQRVRFGDDGAVTLHVTPMPNGNEAGRMFAGWDTELLREAEQS